MPDAALDRFRFPLFPIVGKGRSLLQPIHANDVAKAVLLALERPLAIGKSYDIMGPQRMTLRQVVQVVAEGMAMKLWIVSTPIWIHRLAVHGMNALLSNPLATPAQLQMLSDGLYGDGLYGDLEPARQDLGLEPLAFTGLHGALRPRSRGSHSFPLRAYLIPLEKGARDYIATPYPGDGTGRLKKLLKTGSSREANELKAVKASRCVFKRL